MVQVKIKIGPKGQILIPKIFRERYGLRERGYAIIEARDDGLLIRGRPSIKEAMESLREHWNELDRLEIRGPKLGDLKDIDLETEFDEKY